MNISAPFIKRPIGTSLLAAGLLMSGALAFNFLPVAPLPQVESPVIQVQANLPGASPETMASAVAVPLERQFGRIAGITQMTSTSQFASTSVVLTFDLNRNIDAAARDVQAAINAARGQLPANLPNNPNHRKVNPAESPIMILALTSDLVPLPRIYDVADSILAQKISQVNGVGQVFVSGGAKPAVRAELNPTLLNKLGVGLDQVRMALNLANANRPKGEVSNVVNAWSLGDTDQLFRADEYRKLIVSSKNGAVVRLGDVGDVQDSVEDRRNMGLENGKPAVLVMIFRQPAANIIDTVDRVRSVLPQLQASIPPSIKLDLALDRTVSIRASVLHTELSLGTSIVLVILVVFAFLRTVRATLIPSVAVPLSLIGTFGVMYLFGYSLDNLSLMALAISTGFVVDDAIVVLENVTRHLEHGMPPVQAAFQGAREIGFTVLSMSTSLVAVFIPILLMGGLIGRLFREFAVTLSVAVGLSLVISLTVTPTMCAKVLRALEPERRHNWFYRLSEGAFNIVLAGYKHSLRWVLRHQFVILLVTIGAAVLSVVLFRSVPTGFFPQQDNGRLIGSVQGAQDISFLSLRQKTLQLATLLKKDPAVDTVVGFAGGGSTNSARVFVTLKPLSERKASADQVVNRLRGKLAVVPGVSMFLVPGQDLQIGGRQSSSQYQYTLESENLTDLNTWAPRLLEKLRTLPELRDVTTDQQDHGLQARVVIDRDTAGRLGVNPQDIDNTLYDAFGQRQVSTMYRALNQYHVVMEVDPRFSDSPDSLQNVYVRSSHGNEVPLAAFAHFEHSSIAIAVNHQGQFPAATISFSLAPGVTLGQATQVIENAERAMSFPANIHASFAGTAAAFQESLSKEPYLILAALLTVYVVLGVLYESYIHPVTILSTLPSAGVGALLALLVAKLELNIIGLIGILLLIGIVKKNAIMMIDFALETERREPKSPEDAIYEACILRFRPILMTTAAAMLGALPLALGTGTGSELRHPLGITIFWGLAVSQVLTLYTTPVVYIYLDRFRIWAKGRRRVPVGEGTAPASPDPTVAG